MSSSSEDGDYEPGKDPGSDDEGATARAPAPGSDSDDSSSEGGDDPRDMAKRKDLPSDDSDEDDDQEAPAAAAAASSSSGAPAKKKRRKGGVRGSDFILDDVDVDDEEEEEFEDADGEPGVDPAERAEAEKAFREIQRKRDERRRPEFMGPDMTEDQIQSYFEDKYGGQQGPAMPRPGEEVEEDEEGFGDQMDEISQQGLLPSTKDPNLWILRCRMGEEKQTALLLMRKFLSTETSDAPLEIKSVVVKEALKGYIYIEAYKQTHVQQAIEGVSAINSYNVKMVPIKDMVDTLRVVKNVPTLKKRTFVRLKRTMFKDDLAQVDWLDVAQNLVHLKLVPRVDMTRMRGALRDQEAPKKNFRRRPPAKLFDEDAVRNIGGELHQDGDFTIFEGNRYRRGFYPFVGY